MSILDIRVLGDPALRKETAVVESVTNEVRSLINDMFDTMYAAEGIGLAAPQVGRTERVTSDTEQDITNGIIKVVSGQQRKIYFTSGHGEKDTTSADRDGYNAIAAALAKWEGIKAEYPGYIRRVILERRSPHHSEGEL